jgi:hypothetical protein
VSHNPPTKPQLLALTGDMKDWARRLINRHELGEKIRPYSLNLAREALKARVSA